MALSQLQCDYFLPQFSPKLTSAGEEGGGADLSHLWEEGLALSQLQRHSYFPQSPPPKLASAVKERASANLSQLARALLAFVSANCSVRDLETVQRVGDFPWVKGSGIVFVGRQSVEAQPCSCSHGRKLLWLKAIRVLRRVSNTADTTCGVGVQSWQIVLGGKCGDSVEISSMHVRWREEICDRIG